MRSGRCFEGKGRHVETPCETAIRSPNLTIHLSFATKISFDAGHLLNRYGQTRVCEFRADFIIRSDPKAQA